MLSKWGNRPIRKENILLYISEYDIFKYYCTPFNKLGEAFCSELRVDNRPTCFIVYFNSRLLYKDFADKSLDCFAYVQVKYNLEFKEALQLIVSDFRLPLGFSDYRPFTNSVQGSIEKNVKNVSKSPTIIEVSIRKWNLEDKKFWFDRYGITCKELNDYDVYPLDRFYINGVFMGNSGLTYGYYLGESSSGKHQWKIYRPYVTKGHGIKVGKWFSNCDGNNLQGFNQLKLNSDILIITKSLKDVIVLRKLGFDSVAPHGEGHMIDKNIITSLSKRFTHISLLYDNDAPGIEASNYLSQIYSLDNIILPTECGKDVSDFVEQKGYNELREFLASHYSQLGIRLPEIKES